MANIKPYTDKIANAIYGEEVRGSIINALNAVNTSGGSGGTGGGGDGVGISAITQLYARSTSYTTAPADSSFSTSQTALTSTYPYQWAKITYTFTDETTPTVVNNVTSTSTTSALSAYQGKLLADRVNTLENTGGSSSKGFIINVYSGDHTDLSTGAKTLEALRNGIVPLIYTGTTYAPAISSKVEYVCGAYQMTLHYYDMTCGYPNLAEIQLNTDLMCE